MVTPRTTLHGPAGMRPYRHTGIQKTFLYRTEPLEIAFWPSVLSLLLKVVVVVVVCRCHVGWWVRRQQHSPSIVCAWLSFVVGWLVGWLVGRMDAKHNEPSNGFFLHPSVHPFNPPVDPSIHPSKHSPICSTPQDNIHSYRQIESNKVNESDEYSCL